MNGTRILIVDPEEELAQVIKLRLESDGFAVSYTTTVESTLALLEESKIQIMICDIQSPGGIGVDLVKAARVRGMKLPPFLFMTGYSDVEHAEIYDLGAEAIIAKPLNFADLVPILLRTMLPPDKRWSRRHERIPCDGEIEIHVENFANSKAVNIGRGGAFIASESDFPKRGDRLQLILMSADGVHLEFQALVRWVRENSTQSSPAGYGVEFTDMSNENSEKLKKIIEKLKTLAFIPSH